MVDHTLFNAPEHHQPPVNSNVEGASRDDYEEFMNNPQEPHFASPQHQANNPNQPSQPQPPLITENESTDWDTRATILLCETIVVTLIVGSIIFCCLCKHYRKLAESQRVVITREQLQELATIRISPEASSSSSSPAGVENTNANTAAAAAASNSRNRSTLQRISHALSYPLRMLESGINSWATENQDEIFLRQFIERLDAEREAARENPDDRERRVKEAFVKECMIWVSCIVFQFCYMYYLLYSVQSIFCVLPFLI